MKIVNGSSSVLLLPLGGSMMPILPKNVSGDVVATKQLVTAAITSLGVDQLGLVTYSAAELQVINSITGAAPFLYQNLDDAIAKLIPGGVKPIVETRIVAGGETVMQKSEEQQENPGTLHADPNASKELLEAKTSLGELAEQLKEKDETIKTLNEKVTSKDQEIKGLNTKITDLTAKLNAPADNSEHEKQIKNLNATIDKLTTNIDASDTENKKLKDKIASLEKLVAEKSAKIDELATAEQGVDPAKLDEALAAQKVAEDKFATLEKDYAELKQNFDKAANFKTILEKTRDKNNLVWSKDEGCYIPA